MKFLKSLTFITAFFSTLLAAAPTSPLDALAADSNITAVSGNIIPNSFVVLLKEGVTKDQFEAHQRWAQAKLTSRLQRRDELSSPNATPPEPHHYDGIQASFDLNGLYGYTGSFDNDTITDITGSEEVEIIEPDQVVVAYDTESQADTVSQTDIPSWGLGQISSGNDDAYSFHSSAGAGVNIYILDTGINTAHVDFGGRATWGANLADGNNADNQGHGTHVAGTAGGTKFGVAKKANLIAVKVLSDSGAGSTSKLIQGIEWTIAHASSRGNNPGRSVVNMSLGGSYSPATNRAVAAATAKGLTFVVAAGNDGKLASNYSPASAPEAITVGAVARGNVRAPYSNYGPAVDIFAPGSNIVSDWNTGRTDIHTLSGTSMASPHVAGLAATIISKEGITGGQNVARKIMQLAKRGMVKDAGAGSPNVVVWNGS